MNHCFSTRQQLSFNPC